MAWFIVGDYSYMKHLFIHTLSVQWTCKLRTYGKLYYSGWLRCTATSWHTIKMHICSCIVKVPYVDLMSVYKVIATSCALQLLLDFHLNNTMSDSSSESSVAGSCTEDYNGSNDVYEDCSVSASGDYEYRRSNYTRKRHSKINLLVGFLRLANVVQCITAMFTVINSTLGPLM